jgi:hypothetical protein
MSRTPGRARLIRSSISGGSSPCSCTAPGRTLSDASITSSAEAGIITMTGVTNGGRRRAISRACSTLIRLGDRASSMPTASAPQETHFSASSTVRTPQIFTRIMYLRYNGHTR